MREEGRMEYGNRKIQSLVCAACVCVRVRAGRATGGWNGSAAWLFRLVLRSELLSHRQTDGRTRTKPDDDSQIQHHDNAQTIHDIHGAHTSGHNTRGHMRANQQQPTRSA